MRAAPETATSSKLGAEKRSG
uniref:Uncharacterized protein n=1 Tax=Arundo donax TaxID=35708 RepID=A0A0A8Y1T6_ARUDO